MEKVSWENLIKIDRTWVAKQLTHHYLLRNPKLNIRAYTVKFSGNLCDFRSIIEELTNFQNITYTAKKQSMKLVQNRHFYPELPPIEFPGMELLQPQGQIELF